MWLPAMSVAIAHAQSQAVESMSIATQITVSQPIATQVALANDGLRDDRCRNGLNDGCMIAQSQAESVATIVSTVATIMTTKATIVSAVATVADIMSKANAGRRSWRWRGSRRRLWCWCGIRCGSCQAAAQAEGCEE